MRWPISTKPSGSGDPEYRLRSGQAGYSFVAKSTALPADAGHI